MPVLSEDWISTPLLRLKDLLLEGDLENFQERVFQYFASRITLNKAQSKLPYLNEIDLRQVKPGSLVQFRCMPQDNYGPDLYLPTYMTRNGIARTGLFIDEPITDVINPEEVFSISGKERNVYLCIAPPAETQWVLDDYSDMFHLISGAGIREGSLVENKLKRHRDSSNDDINAEPVNRCFRSDSDATLENKNDVVNHNGHVPKPPDYKLMYPLPNCTGSACLVKTYNDLKLNLNEVYLLTGVISDYQDDTPYSEDDAYDGNCLLNAPSSFIPRLHVITALHLPSDNPNFAFSNLGLFSEFCARQEFVNVCTSIMSGDQLAGEYFFLNLLSRVHFRTDELPLGSLAVNFTNISKEIISNAKSFMENVTCRFHMESMSIETLNSALYSSKKDHDRNQLIPGRLQLPPHTHLLVDETTLQPGELSVQGVKNVAALGNLIRWQRVTYDFEYSSVEFDCDIPVIIMSCAKSLLPSNVLVPVSNNRDSTLQIGSATLKKIRNFISSSQLVDYSIDDSLQKEVEDYFVAQRHESKISVDEMHNFMSLLRLLTLSYGERSLTHVTLEKAKSMESERIARLSSLSSK